MKQCFSRIILYFFVLIHDFSYGIISRLSIMTEGGIHPKHRLMRYHEFFLENIHSNDTVLDVGCGNGFLTYNIARKAKNVTGIDLEPKNIDFANRYFHSNNINYIVGDATKSKFSTEYDVVILSNILEHINDRKDFLRKIKRLVDRFLIRVPCVDRDWLTYYKKELGLFYFSDRTHKTEYTIDSFKAELSEAGLKIKSASVQFGEIWAVVVKSGEQYDLAQG